MANDSSSDTRHPAAIARDDALAQAKALTERIKEALYEVSHYRELAQDALESGDLASAKGWLRALCVEATKELIGEVYADDVESAYEDAERDRERAS